MYSPILFEIWKCPTGLKFSGLWRADPSSNYPPTNGHHVTFPFIQLKSRWLVAAATWSCIIFLKRQQAIFFSWSETTYSEKWYYILPSSSRRILWVVRFFWKIVTMHFCQNMVHSKLKEIFSNYVVPFSEIYAPFACGVWTILVYKVYI